MLLRRAVACTLVAALSPSLAACGKQPEPGRGERPAASSDAAPARTARPPATDDGAELVLLAHRDTEPTASVHAVTLGSDPAALTERGTVVLPALERPDWPGHFGVVAAHDGARAGPRSAATAWARPGASA